MIHSAAMNIGVHVSLYFGQIFIFHVKNLSICVRSSEASAFESCKHFSYIVFTDFMKLFIFC